MAENGTAKGLVADFAGCFRITGANRREEDHEEADAYGLASSPKIDILGFSRMIEQMWKIIVVIERKGLILSKESFEI